MPLSPVPQLAVRHAWANAHGGRHSSLCAPALRFREEHHSLFHGEKPGVEKKRQGRAPPPPLREEKVQVLVVRTVPPLEGDQGDGLGRMGSAYQGRQPVRIQTPPPPLQAPEIFEPVFLQFEMLRETVGAKGVGNFFGGPLEGEFFLPHVSILKMIRFLSRNQKWVKTTKKHFDFRPDL